MLNLQHIYKVLLRGDDLPAKHLQCAAGLQLDDALPATYLLRATGLQRGDARPATPMQSATAG